MTKEEKALQYGLQFADHEIHTTSDVESAFVVGYESAESDNEQMMCKFAEWCEEKQLVLVHKSIIGYNEHVSSSVKSKIEHFKKEKL